MFEPFKLDGSDPVEAHVLAIAEEAMIAGNMGSPGRGCSLPFLSSEGTIAFGYLYEIVRYHRIAKAESQDRRRELDEIHALSTPEDQVK